MFSSIIFVASLILRHICRTTTKLKEPTEKFIAYLNEKIILSNFMLVSRRKSAFFCNLLRISNEMAITSLYNPEFSTKEHFCFTRSISEYVREENFQGSSIFFFSKQIMFESCLM